MSIYFIFYPIFSKIIEKVIPGLTYCPFLAMTGKPCPFCGGTRFVEGIPKHINDINYFLCFFGFLIIVIVIELIFRVINLFKKEFKDKYINLDIIFHIILISIIVIYEIVYIILILKS